MADTHRSDAGAPVAGLILVAVLSALLVRRLEPDLLLLAVSVTCLLSVVLVESRTADPHRWLIPRGGIALLAAVHLIWLIGPAIRLSTAPQMSQWSGWLLGLLPLGYLAGLHLRRREGAANRTWDGIAALIVLEAVWSNIRYFSGVTPRGIGGFLDPNAFGGLLYCLLVPTMALYADPAQPVSRRRLAVGAMTLVFLALFSTQSRGAGGTLLLLSLALVIVLRAAGLAVLRPAIIITAIALACYLAVRLTTPYQTRTLALSTDPSTLGRLMLWKSSWNAWLEHPWFGTGVGTFRLQYRHYRLPTEISTTGDLAHCDYLQMLMEGGPVLLGFLLAWGLVACWLALGLYRRLRDARLSMAARRSAMYALTLVLAVLGLFLHASVNFIFYVAPLSLLAGLALAHAQHALSGPQLREIRIPANRRLVRALATLLIAVPVGGLAADWSASMMLSPWMPSTPASLVSAPPEQRYRAATYVVALRPYNLLAQQTLASTATELALAQRGQIAGRAWADMALDDGKRLLEISRDSAYAWELLGRLLVGYPQLGGELSVAPGGAAALFRLAIGFYPASPSAYRLLATEQEKTKQPVKALETLHSALVWRHIPVQTPAAYGAWLALIQRGRELSIEQLQADAAPGLITIARDFGSATAPPATAEAVAASR